MNSEKFDNDYCKKHELCGLLDEVIDWRNKRNKLIHDLVGCPYTNEEIKDIAIKGYELLLRLNNRSTLVNNHNDELRSKVVC